MHAAVACAPDSCIQSDLDMHVAHVSMSTQMRHAHGVHYTYMGIYCAALSANAKLVQSRNAVHQLQVLTAKGQSVKHGRQLQTCAV